MILQSESAGSMPLLGEALRDVSRLEFFSVAPPMAETVVEVGREVTDVEALKLEHDAEEEKHESQVLEMRAQMESIRRDAKAEARLEWEKELSERVTAERVRVVGVCEEFGRERTKYFAAVESEVVKLALAIATRVLHREAKMDPLMLKAAVRVALGKVAEESSILLRVPVADVEMWQGLFRSHDAVQFVGDERMAAGECVLETSVGKVELGVAAQLEEIEKGFFDLLEQRPA